MLVLYRNNFGWFQHCKFQWRVWEAILNSLKGAAETKVRSDFMEKRLYVQADMAQE